VKREPGNYLGTSIDGKWWRRYTRRGWFARGNGHDWYDHEAFYFQRLLDREPVVLPLDEVDRIEVGRRHSGRWAGGRPVLKIGWREEGLALCSGFAVAVGEDEACRIRDELRRRVAATSGSQHRPRPQSGC
jgi:hypothetical protein